MLPCADWRPEAREKGQHAVFLIAIRLVEYCIISFIIKLEAVQYLDNTPWFLPPQNEKYDQQRANDKADRTGEEECEQNLGFPNVSASCSTL